MVAIEIKNLGFSYGDRPVLENVTVDIESGKFTVILGKNGCGKSTLFKIVTGIERYNKGAVIVSGQDISGLSSRARARKIGYLPQHHRPVFPFSVMDVVLTGRASHVALTPKKEDRRIAGEAIERVGIGRLKDRAFTELSGGEQQMAMIARVLAQGPEIVLLDEPTSHLDIFNQAKILKLVRELANSGLTVVAVLHDPNSAFVFGDEFVFMREGRILPLPPDRKPWDAEFLRQVYDARLKTIEYGKRALVVPEGDSE